MLIVHIPTNIHKMNEYFIKINSQLIPYFNEMLMELYECKLEVCLIPSEIESVRKDGGMIRVAYSKNPEWYSELCSLYIRKSNKKKKFRTIIKRKNIINILINIIKNKYSNSKYAEYLFNIAKDRKKTENDYLINNLQPWENQF